MMSSDRDYYSSDIRNFNKDVQSITSHRKAMRFNIEKSKWSSSDRFKQTFSNFQKNSDALKNRAQSSHFRTIRNRAVFQPNNADANQPISSPEYEQILNEQEGDF